VTLLDQSPAFQGPGDISTGNARFCTGEVAAAKPFPGQRTDKKNPCISIKHALVYFLIDVQHVFVTSKVQKSRPHKPMNGKCGFFMRKEIPAE
jgi:hypothetical protein